MTITIDAHPATQENLLGINRDYIARRAPEDRSNFHLIWHLPLPEPLFQRGKEVMALSLQSNVCADWSVLDTSDSRTLFDFCNVVNGKVL